MRLIEKHERPVYVLEFTWDELWGLFRCLRILEGLKPGEPTWAQLTANVANLDENPQRVAKKLADQLELYVADREGVKHSPAAGWIACQDTAEAALGALKAEPGIAAVHISDRLLSDEEAKTHYKLGNIRAALTSWLEAVQRCLPAIDGGDLIITGETRAELEGWRRAVEFILKLIDEEERV